MRPNKIQTAMSVAKVIAMQSHDTERQVGCVVLNKDTHAIIATGYNGFVRGAPDNQLPSSGVSKNEYMMHAEQNAIFNCTRHGISMNNCIVVCTLSPCPACVRALWQCGIREVYYENSHSSIEHTIAMRDIHVMESLTNDGFFRLIFKRR